MPEHNIPGEIRATVKADELAPKHREFDSQLATGLTIGKIPWSHIDPIDMTVGKGGGIEFSRVEVSRILFRATL